MKSKLSTTAVALSLFSLLFVGLSFQNCGQVPLSQKDVEPSQTIKKLEAKQFSKLSFPSYLDETNVTVDLTTGGIEKSSFSSHVVHQRLCLPSADLDQLKTIVSNEEICIPPDKKIPADWICGQGGPDAYVILSEGNQSIELGAQSTTCQAAVNLCDYDSAVAFQELIADITMRLDQMSCL